MVGNWNSSTVVFPYISEFTEFQREMKFSSNSVPLKRLIVHHTKCHPGGWVFNNHLAYDISRRIGCMVPETKWTLLFVNGVDQRYTFSCSSHE